MKSLFKLLFASFLTSFSFVAAHASVVETDTVMSQKYVETEQMKASSVTTESALCNRGDIGDLTVKRSITMLSNRSGEWVPPSFVMYSQPYQGAVVFKVGFSSDSAHVDTGVEFTSVNAIGSAYKGMSFNASEYNFKFDEFNNEGTGVMNVDGKIVCKEEIRVAEVNTNKVNSDEVNTKGITAKEINVEMDNAADYVFEEGYDLKSLDEVEAFVKSNKHLPGVPSASQFKENGMNVSEMSNLLLEKVEELTLHLIRLQKEVEQLREENNALKNKR